jgi:hypothetical protein
MQLILNNVIFGMWVAIKEATHQGASPQALDENKQTVH